MKHVHPCLTAGNDRESSFHHCRSCEARASLFESQENPRKQFLPLWRHCEACASQFMCGKDLIKPF